MTISPLLHIWLSIAFVAVLAVCGEVLIAAGMRQLGDLDDIRATTRTGRNDSGSDYESVVCHRRPVHGGELLRHALCVEHSESVSGRPSDCRADLHRQCVRSESFPARACGQAALAGDGVRGSGCFSC